MWRRGPQGSLIVLYLFAALLLLGVLAVTLPRLTGGADVPTPLGRPPVPTATQEALPSPTPLPTVLAYVPATASPAANATASPGTAQPPLGSPNPLLLPVGQSGPWHLVFQDEFDGGALNHEKWTPCYPWFDPATGCTSEGNQELQWYLPTGVTVQNGVLTLSANPDRYKAPDGHTYQYTSGLVASGSSKFTGPGFSVPVRLRRGTPEDSRRQGGLSGLLAQSGGRELAARD